MYNQYQLEGTIEYKNIKDSEKIQKSLMKIFEDKDIHLDIKGKEVYLIAEFLGDDLEDELSNICFTNNILDGVKINLEGYNIYNDETIFRIIVDMTFQNNDLISNVDYCGQIEYNDEILQKLGLES